LRAVKRAGHVILALYKMKASGFSEEVLPYQESKVAWIRKEAERYLEFDRPPRFRSRV
jgi:hypothetical protein